MNIEKKQNRSWKWSFLRGALAITFTISIAFNITNTFNSFYGEAQEEVRDIYVYVIREEAEDARPVVDYTESEPHGVRESVQDSLPQIEGGVVKSGVPYDSIPLWPGKWIKINKPDKEQQ